MDLSTSDKLFLIILLAILIFGCFLYIQNSYDEEEIIISNATTRNNTYYPTTFNGPPALKEKITYFPKLKDG